MPTWCLLSAKGLATVGLAGLLAGCPDDPRQPSPPPTVPKPEITHEPAERLPSGAPREPLIRQV